MLRTRALTAAVLLAGFGSALFLLPQAGWIAFCAVLLALAAWEWGGLASLAAPGRSIYSGVLVLVFLAIPHLAGAYAPAWVYTASALFWVVLAPLWMWRSSRVGGAPLLLAVGVLTLVPAGAALVDLRAGHPGLLLAVLGTVWISDSTAYFVGRRFGRRKLAPSISPGKTWEGVYGALLATALYALVLLVFAPDGLHSRTLSALAVFAWVAVVLGLTGLSVVGDLFESLLKRQRGLKDSGKLLPGHGGVLDRIDALLAAMPAAALVVQYALR